ncbi:MAG: FAD-dependent oxidoreductase [Clostridiales bacterium]|nr:FAD-dependent oxidoreductase [Clostridiales bacterium]
MKHVVVIGGGVAAKGFLEAGVAFNKDTKFTFVRDCEKSPVPCGIPYTFGTLESPYDNTAQDKGLIKKGVNLIIDEVIDVDVKTKTVKLKKGEDLSYDKLVLATGAVPFVPPFPGKDLENIEVIVKDLDFINEQKERILAAKNVVIVGGGFIGVEIADEVAKLGGKNIVIVELMRNILSAAFDVRFCVEAETLLREKGIKVLTEIGVTEFRGNDKVEKVVLADGSEIDADFVLMSIGVKPNVELGLKMGLNGDGRSGIIVDAYQYTSNPDVLAIGDCASKVDLITGKPSGIKLASVAAREGRIAAANIFTKTMSANPKGVTSLFSTAIDNVYFGATGMTHEQLLRENIEHEVISVGTTDRHPETLPDASEMVGDFMFANENGKFLGCQIRGGSQIAEAINFLGYALQQDATAQDLFVLNYASHPMGTASPNKYLPHMAATQMLKRMKK